MKHTSYKKKIYNLLNSGVTLRSSDVPVYNRGLQTLLILILGFIQSAQMK